MGALNPHLSHKTGLKELAKSFVLQTGPQLCPDLIAHDLGLQLLPLFRTAINYNNLRIVLCLGRNPLLAAITDSARRRRRALYRNLITLIDKLSPTSKFATRLANYTYTQSMGMAFVCVERDLRRGPIANSARRRRREFAKSVGRQHKYPWGFSAIQIAHIHTCMLFVCSSLCESALGPKRKHISSIDYLNRENCN